MEVVVVAYLFLGCIQGVIFGYATNAVINNKGYYENWFWWGFFFGLIALLVALSKPEAYCEPATNLINLGSRSNQVNPDTWRCPSCSRTNSSRDDLCHCGTGKPYVSPRVYTWTCKFCDRRNPGTAAICYCGHKKSESRGAVNGDKLWKCRFCGKSNSIITTVCNCGHKKAESTVSPNAEREPESKNSNPSTEVSSILFPVLNYFPGIPMKILNIRFLPSKDESVPIELECFFYNEDLTALRIEILLTDIWGEQKSFPEIDLQIPQNAHGKITLPYTLRFPPEKLSSIKSVKVLIQRVIIKEEIWKNVIQSEDILLNDTELRNLRTKLGDDAVTTGQTAQYNWTCICGTNNESTVVTCPLCKRNKPD